MSPMKAAVKRGKKKKKGITVDLKKTICKEYINGARIVDLARKYERNKSTIATIVKKRDVFVDADVAKGVKYLRKGREKILDQVEKMLPVWIQEKQLAGDIMSDSDICDKARCLHANLSREDPGGSTDDHFKASRGWFEKFKRRTGLLRVDPRIQAVSPGKAAAEEFVEHFADFIDNGGFVPQQVFSCDDTGLYWKKMPKRTYITALETGLPGHTVMKDRLTLLVCANASGDRRVKPLLVYHSETPRVFKRWNVIKDTLSVMWRANKKAWLTRQIFTEWLNCVFGPTVKKYLLDEGLPLKAVLVMDNSPVHPPYMEDVLLEEFSFITLKFLPPNLTLDKLVVDSFKKEYTKALFQRCFDVTSDTRLALRDFWNDHFNILTCIGLIDKAWNGVARTTLIATWRKLWPGYVAECDVEGSEPSSAVEEIVSLGNTIGLVMDERDVEELLEEHQVELTPDELLCLHLEQHKQALEELSSGVEEEAVVEIPSAEIKDMCGWWENIQGFVLSTFPDKAVASRTLNLFNDNIMGHYRHILKRRQKRVSLNMFLVQQEPSEAQSDLGPMIVKTIKKEEEEDYLFEQ
nr:tigger transposable element-derived protein 1-like [Nerophis lumbriciformis]